MSNTTLRTAIEAIEAQLEAVPSLGMRRSDPLSGPSTMANQRGAVGYEVVRTLTQILDETRNQDTSRVEDLIQVTLQKRLKPKDQKTSRGELYDLEQSVVNRVTELAFNRKWNLTFLDTQEELTGEWLQFMLRFSLKRFMQVGAG